MFEHIVFLRNRLFEDYGVEFHLYEGIYSKAHDHDGYWELFIIIDGSAAHCYRNETTTVRRNYAQIMRPHDCHHFNSHGEPCSHIRISLDNNIVKGMLDGIDAELYYKIIEYEGGVSVNISDAMREELVSKIQKFTILPETKNHSISVELKFIFLTILQKIYAAHFSETINYPVLIRDAIHYMQKHYTDSLSLEEICNYLGCTHISLLRPVSYTHLRKKCTDCQKQQKQTLRNR